MSVYDLVLRVKLHHHRGTPEDNAEGLRLLDQAIRAEPDFAPAYAWRACTRGQAAARGCVKATEEVEKTIYRDVLEGCRSTTATSSASAFWPNSGTRSADSTRR